MEIQLGEGEFVKGAGGIWYENAYIEFLPGPRTAYFTAYIKTHSDRRAIMVISLLRETWQSLLGKESDGPSTSS